MFIIQIGRTGVLHVGTSVNHPKHFTVSPGEIETKTLSNGRYIRTVYLVNDLESTIERVIDIHIDLGSQKTINMKAHSLISSVSSKAVIRGFKPHTTIATRTHRYIAAQISYWTREWQSDCRCKRYARDLQM